MGISTAHRPQDRWVPPQVLLAAASELLAGKVPSDPAAEIYETSVRCPMRVDVLTKMLVPKTLPASLLTTSLLLCLLATSLTTGVPCDDGDLEDGDLDDGGRDDGDLDDDEAGNEDGRWPVM